MWSELGINKAECPANWRLVGVLTALMGIPGLRQVKTRMAESVWHHFYPQLANPSGDCDGIKVAMNTRWLFPRDIESNSSALYLWGALASWVISYNEVEVITGDFRGHGVGNFAILSWPHGTQVSHCRLWKERHCVVTWQDVEGLKGSLSPFTIQGDLILYLQNCSSCSFSPVLPSWERVTV